VLAINAADDERNPVDFGIVAREIKRVALITGFGLPRRPTPRHSGDAKWGKHLLGELLSDEKPGQ
jgi:hypothetical protein